MISAGEGCKQVTAKLQWDRRTWQMTGFAKMKFLFQAYETQQVFHFPGFLLCWLLPEIARWPTLPTKGQAHQQLVLISKGTYRAIEGEGTSLQSVHGGEVCACEDTQNWDRDGLRGYVLLSHTNTVPALSLHPHNAALAKAFTADPEKIIWGAGKSEGCLSWKKERVGGSWSFQSR